MVDLFFVLYLFSLCFPVYHSSLLMFLLGILLIRKNYHGDAFSSPQLMVHCLSSLLSSLRFESELNRISLEESGSRHFSPLFIVSRVSSLLMSCPRLGDEVPRMLEESNAPECI